MNAFYFFTNRLCIQVAESG